jgi:hypothetical protein
VEIEALQPGTVAVKEAQREDLMLRGAEREAVPA